MKKTARKSGKQRSAGETYPLSSPEATIGSGLQHNPLMHLVFIIAVGLVVYCNTLSAPFIFDDYPYLVNNPVIRDFSYFTDSSRILGFGFNADVVYNFVLRPVAYFTFALNYALHGLAVQGYHLVNLTIHIANALLVYALLSLLLKTPVMVADTHAGVEPAVKLRYLPLFCALLFACHPLQTQAVTYIIQRFTPLVTLFCLGSLVMYLQSRLSATTAARTAWYVFSVIIAIIAMGTKENAFTLPVLVALFELLFFYGSTGRRIAGLVPFLLTMAIIPYNLMELSSLAKPEESGAITGSMDLVNFSGVSRWHYLITQFGVITTYLRLLVLPIGQNFDYDYPLRTELFSIAALLPLALLLLILGTGIYCLYRSGDTVLPERALYRITGLGIAWFFITLSVESSIIPIDDLIFEHRTYLPSIGFFMSILAGFAAAHDRRTGKSFFTAGITLWIAAFIIPCLSAASIARNTIWSDKVAFWSDVAAKSPGKARVHDHLGIALCEAGKTEAGIEEFRTAIRLDPKQITPRLNLGKALLLQERHDEAAGELLTAVRLKPDIPLSHVFLGQAYEGKGDLSSARREYITAIKYSPNFPDAHTRLGEIHAREGNIREAIKELEITLQIQPDENIRNRILELRKETGT